MKPPIIVRTLFMALILLSGPKLKSQSHVGFGVGYSFGRVGAPILNEVIDRYNLTRSWLDKEMHNIHGLNGLDFNLRVGGNWLFVTGFRVNSRRVYAEGTPPGGEFGWRKFKVSHGELMLGLETPQLVALRLGTGLYVASTKFKTRTNLDDDMSRISSDGGFGFRLYLRAHLPLSDNLGINFIPYFQTDLYKADVFDVEKTLDAANWTKFDREDFQERITMVGLTVALYFKSQD